MDDQNMRRELKYQRLRGTEEVPKTGLDYMQYKEALYAANKKEMLNREKRFIRKIKGLHTPQ